MSNTEKIKAEIERLKTEYYNSGTFMDSVAKTALNKLLSFIDTLEQEPSLPSDVYEAVHEYMQHIPESEPELMDSFFTWEQMEAAFKAGAEWMKSQTK